MHHIPPSHPARVEVTTPSPPPNHNPNMASPRPTATALAATFASRIHNKPILIPGPPPASLGFALALALAPPRPRLLILAGRSPSKLAESAALLRAAHPDVAIRLLTLDLGSQASVRAAAAE